MVLGLPLKYFGGAIVLAFSVATAGGQVGHLPAESPFVDLPGGHELGFFGGHYSAGRDPVGVAPRSGPLFGLRYEKTVGGPAALMVRYAFARIIWTIPVVFVAVTLGLSRSGVYVTVTVTQ